MIKTSRLNIAPLNYDQFKDYIDNGCGSIITEEDKKWVQENHLDKIGSGNYLYTTFWIATNKEQEVVGEIAFKGEVNHFGEIEIGCYVMPEFRHKGYGTEMIDGMVDWAQQQGDARFVVAGVDHSNIFSQKMLGKNNFAYWGEKENMNIYYKILN